jgi:hypothetical protein
MQRHLRRDRQARAHVAAEESRFPVDLIAAFTARIQLLAEQFFQKIERAVVARPIVLCVLLIAWLIVR